MDGKLRILEFGLVMAAFSLAACGGTTVCAASCGVLASPPPAVILTEKDFGTSVTAVTGQSLEVHLTDRRPFPGSSTIWTVTSSDPGRMALAGETRGVAAPARDSNYVAIFSARSTGTVSLIASGRTSCEAMQKSACPDRSEQVTVEIR